MNYIKSYESFKNHKINNEQINEEFIGSLLKNIFNKTKELINKTKGGKELDLIFNKYQKQINDVFAKQLGINNKPDEKSETNEKINLKIYEDINDETNSASDKEEKINPPEALKKFNSVEKTLNDLVSQIVKSAETEMNNVLKKYGGESQNPKLASLVDIKKNELILLSLRSKLDYLNKNNVDDGDKIKKDIQAKINEGDKNINSKLQNIDKLNPTEIVVGTKYYYKRNKFNEEKWNKLSITDKNNIDDNIVKPLLNSEEIGYAELVSVNNDEILLKSKLGNIKKSKSDILGKSKSDNKQEETNDDISKSLGKIKNDKDKMKIIGDISNLLSDDSKKEYIDKIKEILYKPNEK